VLGSDYSVFFRASLNIELVYDVCCSLISLSSSLYCCINRSSQQFIVVLFFTVFKQSHSFRDQSVFVVVVKYAHCVCTKINFSLFHPCVCFSLGSSQFYNFLDPSLCFEC
jgi:hypothetical protein